MKKYSFFEVLLLVALFFYTGTILTSCGSDGDDNKTNPENSTSPNNSTDMTDPVKEDIPESISQFVGYWDVKSNSNAKTAYPDMKIFFFYDGYCLISRGNTTYFETKEWNYNEPKMILATSDYQWDISMIGEQTWTGTAQWHNKSPYTATRESTLSKIFPILATGTWICKSDNSKIFTYTADYTNYNGHTYCVIKGINPENIENLEVETSQFSYDENTDIMTQIYSYTRNHGNPAKYTIELIHPYSYKNRILHVKYELGYEGDYHYKNDPFDEVFELQK